MATDTTKPVAPELWPTGKWTTSPRVTMSTGFGNAVIELAPNSAQYTVVNFLAYVNTGFYKNLIFHRVIPSFVVQGGGFSGGLVHKTPSYFPITLESHTGLTNARGTIAMARTSDPNSATSQFFVNLVNNSNLNYHSASDPGYAVFGKVVSGMAVFDAIAKVATGDRGGQSDVPLKDVLIKSAIETTTGTIHDKTGHVSVGGVEVGAVWEYTTDHGRHWTTGSNTTMSFKLAEGPYEANDILVRQTDAAGNHSALGHTGASVVMYAGTAILGNATANVLTGTRGADHIYGLAGNDSLTGGAGNDFLDGGSGRDTMTGGIGNDTYIVRDLGDVVKETLTGGTDLVKSFATAHTLGAFVENGQIMLTGTANLTGNGLDNTLFAGQGNNVLDGGNGTDTVSYASGVGGSQGVDVSLAVTTAQDTGGSGTDTLISIENLTGSAFADHLTGNADANVLRGGAGADTLTGGGGADILTGGADNDVFNFDALSDLTTDVATTATVTDFTAGDVLDLSGIDANSVLANDQAFNFIGTADFSHVAGELRYSVNGNTATVAGDVDGNGVADFVLQLTSVTSLVAGDFVV